MLNKRVKQVILETKEKKEKLLIEKKIVKSRMLIIFESEENIKNFNRLPKEKKEKIAFKVFEEINYLSENGLLNEQLSDFLGKIFGNALGGIGQTIAEPLVDSLLSSIGLTGYFKNFLVSFITSNPLRLAKALTSCEELTKLVSESLAEAIVMKIQNDTGFQGQGLSFIRNTLGGVIRDVKFIQLIENQISSVVCSLYDKMTDKASGVYSKLKGL